MNWKKQTLNLNTNLIQVKMVFRNVIFVIIFFSLFYKNAFANCNFKHHDYIDDLKKISSIKSIEIDVNKKRDFYKNFARIIVSKNDNIPNELKKNFRATVTINYLFGKCLYKGKVRQLGDWKDHIKVVNGQPQRSLKVSLEEGNIFNSVKFKLYIPETRKNYNEILGSVILNELGILSPETFETNLTLNGSKFKMLFQEDTTKELLERNLRREGPIFEGDESIIWSYKEKKNFELEDISLARLTNYKWFLKGNSSENIVLKSFNLLQSAYLEYTNKFPSSILLIFPNGQKDKIFKDYYFLLTAMNGWHALRPHNRKFYYNTFIDKFEPIYYDGMLHLNEPLWINNIKNDLNVFSKDYSFSYLSFFQNKQFLDKVLRKFNERIIESNYETNVFFSSSINNIIKNLNFLNNKIKLNKIDNSKKNEKTNLLIEKYLSKVDHYKINQKNIIGLNKQEKYFIAQLNNNEKIKLNRNEISNILRNNSYKEQRYVVLNINNIDESYKNINRANFNFDNSKNGKIIYSKDIKININEKDKIINIKQSNPLDWILFKSVDIKNWKINFFGKTKIVTGTDNSSRFNNQGLTGCLNFFNSNFENISFNIFESRCEDGLNIVNSSGYIKSIYVKNSISDAVDFDFSNIEINSLIVSNAGNDCLDVSGGKYKIIKTDLDLCGDKGISVGEMSIFNGDKISIKNSKIGISTKDLSKSLINSFSTNLVETCVEAFMKKQEFGGALANLNSANCNGNYIKDTNSNILKKL